MPNPFAHIELSSTDTAKSKEFYSKLFTWEYADSSAMPDYTLIKAGSGPGGGIMKQMIPGAPSAWLPYVEVDDIEASTKKAATLGAKVMRDVMPVADMGFISILVDPAGAAIGLWQAKKK